MDLTETKSKARFSKSRFPDQISDVFLLWQSSSLQFTSRNQASTIWRLSASETRSRQFGEQNHSNMSSSLMISQI